MFDDVLSTSTNAQTGLININVASREVIATLPELDEGDADAIVGYRQSNLDNLTSVAWITEALNDPDKVAAIAPFITDKGHQFTADISALGKNMRGYRRSIIVFDISEELPKIVYRREMTREGWALGQRNPTGDRLQQTQSTMNIPWKKKSASVLGIAFEGRRLHAAALRQDGAGLRIVGQTDQALTLDPLTDDPAQVGVELKSALDQAELREKQCVVGVPIQWTLTNLIKLPEVDEEDVQDYLDLQIEKVSPSRRTIFPSPSPDFRPGSKATTRSSPPCKTSTSAVSTPSSRPPD